MHQVKQGYVNLIEEMPPKICKRQNRNKNNKHNFTTRSLGGYGVCCGGDLKLRHYRSQNVL